LFGGFGWIIFFATGSCYLPFPIIWTAVCVVFVLGSGMWKMFPLRRNPGVYRISIDDHGIYVRNDAPAFAPSFSVVAPDIARLIHTTIIRKSNKGDSKDHEYYVENKAGERFPIEKLLLVNPEMPAMELFEKITARFHWVTITEEVKESP
jgi:hypothetical protein